eukprot:5869024-Prymnesium_polylepis.1
MRAERREGLAGVSSSRRAWWRAWWRGTGRAAVCADVCAGERVCTRVCGRACVQTCTCGRASVWRQATLVLGYRPAREAHTSSNQAIKQSSNQALKQPRNHAITQSSTQAVKQPSNQAIKHERCAPPESCAPNAPTSCLQTTPPAPAGALTRPRPPQQLAIAARA